MTRGPPVTVELLGPIQARVDGTPVPIGGRNPRVVLAFLALAVDRTVTADQLADAVWGDEAAERSRTTLQVHVSNLRRALASGEAIRSVDRGYRLDGAAVTVDAEQFEAMVDRATRMRAKGRSAEATQLLDDALAHWRGRALDGVEDVTGLDLAAHRLDELRLLALGDRSDLLLDAGRHEELVPELDRLVADHPFREGFRGQLMLALYRSGRQQEALATYQEGRARLADELGLDPAPALQDLEQAILRQAPDIELAGADLGPVVHWLDGAGVARSHLLGAEVVTVGRDPANDVCLDHDGAVSREHAAIEQRNGEWWARDSGRSTNGTFLNGHRMVASAVLADGDVVRCGSTSLLLRLDRPDPANLIATGGATISLPERDGAGSPPQRKAGSIGQGGQQE